MIRAFHATDTDAVMQSWHRASALAHPFLSEALVAQAHEMIRSQFLPIADTTVVEQQGEVVGFIALMGNQVGGLFLDPAHHGRGLGRQLMDHAVQQHDSLQLEVFKANRIGRRFYAAYGFRTLSEAIDDFSGLPVLRLQFDRP